MSEDMQIITQSKANSKRKSNTQNDKPSRSQSNWWSRTFSMPSLSEETSETGRQYQK